MSTFKVSVETLEKVSPHPNADRLELGKLEGMSFQFVILKGKYQVGDRIVYFPVDSELPMPIIERLGLVGKLSGKKQNRVKTIKLRGEISQGLVSSLDLLKNPDLPSGSDVTEELQVTKYEPTPKRSNAGDLLPLPQGVSAYDIEGADRFTHVAEMLMQQKVHITEKLEGMNFSVTILPDSKVMVNQRNYTIIPIEEKQHDFWKIAENSNLINVIKELWEQTGGTLTVYGEFVGPGVQKNIYKLKTHCVYLFDILHDGKYFSAEKLTSTLDSVLEKCDSVIRQAPVLSTNLPLENWLGGKTIQEASNDQSQLANTLREGIVIKPMIEQEIYNFGRLILKQRSPEYLSKYDF